MAKFNLLTKILPVCCILFACVREGSEAPSGQNAAPVHRLEKELFALDTMRVATSLQALYEKYPAFLSTHFRNVMGIDPADTLAYTKVKELLTNPYIRTVASGIDSVYPSLDQFSEELFAAFGRYREDFPDTDVPAVFTYPASLSGFRPAVWNSDSLLAIGIDCFLGADYYLYETTTFPDYITRRFTPEHLLPTTLRGYIQYHFPPRKEQPTFLSAMIYEGKVLYMLDGMLPETPDSLKIGYTREQIGWATTYERDIWAYFIGQDLLYSSSSRDYSKYLDEAPFTVDLGPNSAPRVGAFTGWQIVRKYMEENKDVDLAALMAETDGQKILRLSGYKPR